MFVKDADKLVLADLKERRLLIKAPKFEHDYPFCWRCDTPLIYYARQSWFIKMTAVHDALMRNNRAVNWMPENIKEGRMGTWLENAARFRVGETVPGIVRSCKPYGCFVELTPNLSGLADSREDIPEGRLVSVYIRSIQPQTGKIKLQMVQELGQPDFPTPLHYQITGGSVSGWRYRP